MITANNVCKHVSIASGRLDILSSINLHITRSETIAILGVSGSGKSTLIGMLAGLDQPSSGEIMLADKNITAMDEDGRAAIRALHVGFVFQSFQLMSNMTALENVMLPLELSQSSHAKDQAEQLLQRVGLEDRLHHYPKQLSGGEQQRVAIARAFVTRPDILFADEPTGNLDSKTGSKIIDLLFELNQEHQTTLVLVTHDAMLAKRCQRRIELADGRIVNDGHTA